MSTRKRPVKKRRIRIPDSYGRSTDPLAWLFLCGGMDVRYSIFKNRRRGKDFTSYEILEVK